MMGYNWQDALMGMEKRVIDLQARAARRDTRSEAGMSYWTKVSASCPPGLVVHLRAAYIWNSNTGQGKSVAAIDADFGPSGNCEAPESSLPGSYRGVILYRDSNNNPETETTSEYTTAQEAQTEIVSLMENSDVYTLGLPLALLIIRNNGSVYQGGQILAIEPVNLGKSYLFRMVRPWLHTHSGGPG